MENNIYCDTNIFIDLMDSTRPYAKKSVVLIEEALSKGKTLYINSDTITNAYYVMSKQKRYTQKELLSLFKKMLSLFTVVAVENQESISALNICEDVKNKFKDYEDALQYVCAKKIHADLIVTNDKGFVSLDIDIKRTT